MEGFLDLEGRSKLKKKIASPLSLLVLRSEIFIVEAACLQSRSIQALQRGGAKQFQKRR
jgi:hypothetical protein